jgi:hypothetical protein
MYELKKLATVFTISVTVLILLLPASFLADEGHATPST